MLCCNAVVTQVQSTRVCLFHDDLGSLSLEYVAHIMCCMAQFAGWDLLPRLPSSSMSLRYELISPEGSSAVAVLPMEPLQQAGELAFQVC